MIELRIIKAVDQMKVAGATRSGTDGQGAGDLCLAGGGESGDPSSPHFSDQALMFSQGRFRDVLFYPEDVRAHAERSYNP